MPPGDAQSIVDDLAAQLRIVPTSSTRPEPGQAVGFTLSPSPDQLAQTGLTSNTLGLAWITKLDRYKDADPVPLADPSGLTSAGLGIVGGQPLTGFPLIGQVVASVPGTLGQLVSTLTTAKLPLGVQVTWIVRDTNGNDLQEGTDFTSPTGLQSPDVEFIFPPGFFELRQETLGTAPVEARCVYATVTLTLAGASATADLGPVQVLVPGLLVPLCVAIFRDVNYKSDTLIFVPSYSLVTAANALGDELERVQDTLDRIRTIIDVATFLTGLGAISSAIADDRYIFKQTDKVDHFSALVISDPWYWFETNWDDRASSIVFLGVLGARTSFYNDTHFEHGADSNQGKFDLVCGTGAAVLVPDLRSQSGQPPATIPPGSTDAFERDQRDENFNDSMSSFEFTTLAPPSSVVPPPCPPAPTPPVG